MKKYRKALILLAVVIIIVVAIGILKRRSHNEIEKFFLDQWKEYSSTWKFSYAEINPENKSVIVVFNPREKVKGRGEVAGKIYKILRSEYLDNSESQYQEYSFKLNFFDPVLGESLLISEIVKGTEEVTLENYMLNVPLEDLAKGFPQATKVELYPMRYQNITEISGFQNLTYLKVSNSLSDEEIEYIHSIFPNCKVDEISQV